MSGCEPMAKLTGRCSPRLTRQYPRPQQRRLTRARNTGYDQQARAVQTPRHPAQHLGGGRVPAEEEGRVLLLEGGQPAVRRGGHCPLGWGCAARTNRQHLPGRGLASGRRDEQLPGRAGEAQRTGQQFGRVLAGGAVDTPLQGADRPRAQAVASASSSWVSLAPARSCRSSPPKLSEACSVTSTASPSGKPRPRIRPKDYARPRRATVSIRKYSHL